jgi:hypothetical protein
MWFELFSFWHTLLGSLQDEYGPFVTKSISVYAQTF